MLTLPPEKLKELLIREGIVDESVFEAIKKEAERKRQSVIDVLISQNIITKDLFLTLLAKMFGVERVNLTITPIDENILHLIPEEVARQKKVIVFGRDANGTFGVAMEDPTNLETIDFLTLRLGGKLKPFLATDEDLSRGFSLYEKKLTQDFKQIIEGSIHESVKTGIKGSLIEAAAELPIVAIVDNLLAYAISLRASDIHFEILDDVTLVRYRVDGILHEIIRMPKEIHSAVVARVKVLSSLRVDEHSRPQDGRFRHKIGDQIIDIRVSTIPTYYGEKIVMRLLTAAQKPLSFGELGIIGKNEEAMQSAIRKTFGMILICGPTGSGKTTTLYSILNILNRPEVNIVTVEDPIEYDMRYVNQTQVNPAAGITFASGLRSILRQDPNIVLVGEIRDEETANIAVQAALTGHLVLSSLHTNDAITTLPRLMDMGVPPFLIAAVLNTVSAQRLTRRIHLNCITSYTAPQEVYDNIMLQLKETGLDPKKVALPKTFYRGKGCTACNMTGYHGRIGIFEMFHVSENIRKIMLGKDMNLEQLKELAREEGMTSMFEDGLHKVELGLTTIEEVFRVIRE